MTSVQYPSPAAGRNPGPTVSNALDRRSSFRSCDSLEMADCCPLKMESRCTLILTVEGEMSFSSGYGILWNSVAAKQNRQCLPAFIQANLTPYFPERAGARYLNLALISFACCTSVLTSCLRACILRLNELGLSALRLLRALPSADCGPVDRSHGFQVRIIAACRALRSAVQPFAMVCLQ